MARRRCKPSSLCGSSNSEKRWRIWQQQPVCFEITIKYYTVCAGIEIEITEQEAKVLGNLAFSKTIKKRK